MDFPFFSSERRLVHQHGSPAESGSSAEDESTKKAKSAMERFAKGEKPSEILEGYSGEEVESLAKEARERHEALKITSDKLREMRVAMDEHLMDSGEADWEEHSDRIRGHIGEMTPEEKEKAEDEAFFSNPMSWIKKNVGVVMHHINNGEWGKGITAAAALFGAAMGKARDYLASAFGSTIEALKGIPGVGSMVSGIEKFIGPRRQAFYAALGKAGIELPLAVAAHARKGLDTIEKELSASANGYGAEKLSNDFVKLLSAKGIKGEAAKIATRAQIDGVVAELREVVKKEVAKKPAEGPAPVAKKEIEVKGDGEHPKFYSDGSLEIDGNKWRIKKDDGKEYVVVDQVTLNADGSCNMRDSVTGDPIMFPKEKWEFVLGKLKSVDQKLIKPKDDGTGEEIVWFVRDTA